MFEFVVEVRPEQLDVTYRHIHHAEALKFWEQARLAFLTSLGFPSESYMAMGLFWVIAGIEVRYKREIRAGSLRVTCEHGRIEGKSLILEQRIYNERGKLAVEGRVDCMLLARDTGRAAAIPNEFQQALQAKCP